ncbi:hypothetical protein [Amycolatopsis arida]|uniref:hypothetical protein n=1 Tax=Amycolatopsis arida TaxID=587909 RepID=UPI000B83ACD6|nr:hypothetical protein [Amycolatopsis arida]
MARLRDRFGLSLRRISFRNSGDSWLEDLDDERRQLAARAQAAWQARPMLFDDQGDLRLLLRGQAVARGI